MSNWAETKSFQNFRLESRDLIIFGEWYQNKAKFDINVYNFYPESEPSGLKSTLLGSTYQNLGNDQI